MADTTTVTRRSFLRMGAWITAALAGTGSLYCGRKKGTISTDINPELYSDKGRKKVPASEVIKKSKIGAPRPNIIVILTDDMGYGDLGCYGSRSIRTPNIDRMAAEGMRCTDFYCSSPLCSPSRAGLLTGRYPLRSGLTFPLQPGKDTLMRKLMAALGYMMGDLGIIDLKGARNRVKGLPASEITIPEALKLSGYRTGAIGKWHLGDFVTDMKYHPKNYGFDYFTGFNASNDDWPVSFWRNDTEMIKDIGLKQDKFTGLFTQEAIDFILNAKDGPFFLYLAHKDPHQPCIPSENFRGVSEGGPHGDSVQEVDWSVGRILDCLRKNNLDHKTLVIFTSDNGPWFDGSPGGFRGRKGQSYEGGFRVPMIARWPGRIPAGSHCRAPLMNIDFFPTFLSLAGLEGPFDRIIDGKSLWPLLSGASKEPPHDELFFFHYNEIEGIRSGKWKFFRYINNHAWPIPLDKPGTFVANAAAGRDYKPEGSNVSVPTMGTWPILYNMELDPGESYNVIKKYPGVGKKMLAALENFEREFFKNPRGWLKK